MPPPSFASAISKRARGTFGPAVRRLKREMDWRRHGTALVLDVAESTEDFPHVVFRHETPLFRVLSGLDDQLQINKVTNLRLAVAPLHGRVLQPGQRLSFWYHVRNPSSRRGFLEGLVLDEGRLTAGVGGGLCQLTNLLYWMTLHTPLVVAERWRHTYDVFPDSGRTQPFASGATCAWPSLDLQVVNPTHTTFRLSLRLSRTHLIGTWRSDLPVPYHYEIYEDGHLIKNDLPGVFTRHNSIRRRVFDTSQTLVADEPVCENHALMMYAPFLPPAPERP